ncbi:MAG TPA: ABC transporter substrate-binding protein [Parvibaculum sp.]
MSSLSLLRSAFMPVAFSFALFAAVAASSAPALAANEDPGAEKFVNDISTQAIQIISNKDLDRPAREAAFGKLLDDTADMQRIAVFCLGQYRTLPTDAQKTEYLSLVRNFVVKVYVTRLSDYHDEKLQITGSQAKGATQAIVTSQINFTNGRQPVQVTWWLVKKDGGYKIFDVNVVGIWLAQEQRSSFISVINNHNGDFTALLDHLKTQIADVNAGKPVSTAGAQ